MIFEAEIKGPAKSLHDQLKALIDNEALPYFRDKAKSIVTAKIKEREGEPYTISVDNRLADSVVDINSARKEVRVVWVEAAIKMAIKEFANIFATTAEKRAANWGSIREGVPKSVKVFLGSDDLSKPALRDITGVNTINDFSFGDYIVITSADPWQQYLNTKGKVKGSLRIKKPLKDANLKDHGGGYFGLASRRIKKKLGIKGKFSSAIQVKAFRSKAVLEKIGQPPLRTEEGRANWGKLQYLGAWAIKIKFLNVRRGAVRNAR